MKLGKQPAKKDKRNFLLSDIIKIDRRYKLPEQYDIDKDYLKKNIPNPMYANDRYGCCVITEQAHHTRRFECVEQKKVINFTDNDIIREYLRQSGGVDSGLYLLDSLNEWRQHGLKSYTIKAFAQLQLRDNELVKQAIFNKLGLKIGLLLPITAQKEFENGQVWSKTSGKINSWGGHCVYLYGYNSKGPFCVTWGKVQGMTWAFYNKYCDEAYTVIDSSNTKGIKHSVLDKLLGKL